MLTVSRAAASAENSLNDAATVTRVLSQKFFEPIEALNWLIPSLKKGGRGDLLKHTVFEIPLSPPFSKGEVMMELANIFSGQGIRNGYSASITDLVSGLYSSQRPYNWQGLSRTILSTMRFGMLVNELSVGSRLRCSKGSLWPESEPITRLSSPMQSTMPGRL